MVASYDFLKFCRDCRSLNCGFVVQQKDQLTFWVGRRFMWLAARFSQPHGTQISASLPNIHLVMEFGDAFKGCKQ